jgi:inner membrane protein
MNNPSTHLIDRFNQWLQESITVKLVSIGFLVLILLIPSAWIENLMEERQLRAESVMTEVSSRWSGSQILAGPVLVVPYKYLEMVSVDNDKVVRKESIRKAFFLPETLDVTGKVQPETLHRGIYDAVVYESSLSINASFSKPDFERLDIADNEVLWQEAHLVLAISDLRGISKNPPVITSGNKPLTPEPTQNTGIATLPFNLSAQAAAPAYSTSSASGIAAPLNWSSESDFAPKVDISFTLKGSSQLGFVPAGKTTTVNLWGPWPDPSFGGEFLPATREISDSSFTATWQVLHFNRPFASNWTENEGGWSGSAFGLKLLMPVDQYQKSIRTAKYGILIVLLTFISLVLVEITQRIRIHPFQYILIGAALIIYYTLLLSFSEQVGYTTAYWIATLATVVLLTAYSITFLNAKKLSALFTLLLTIFYSFIFVIIQQQDYSLLIGSIGLFLVLAALMFFSRKIRWYKEANP